MCSLLQDMYVGMQHTQWRMIKIVRKSKVFSIKYRELYVLHKHKIINTLLYNYVYRGIIIMISFMFQLHKWCSKTIIFDFNKIIIMMISCMV